jgi:hypothetical protein
LSFFGRAGVASGKDDVKMKQTALSGSILFYIMPFLSFRFGFATTDTGSGTESMHSSALRAFGFVTF